MSDLSLERAQTIIRGAIEHARAAKLAPLLVLVLDDRAAPKACAAEDGTSCGRYDIAHGKANGALAMGMGSRTLAARASTLPHFFASVATVIAGGMIL